MFNSHRGHSQQRPPCAASPAKLASADQGAPGEIGIAPRHSPLITRLQTGEVRVQAENGEEQMFFVSGGMLEVQPSMVTVLADTALRAKDIDEAAALKAKQEAEEALAERKGDIDMARAQAELAGVQSADRT